MIHKYGLEGVATELRDRYTEEGASLRDLADFVNVRITDVFLADTPFSPRHVYETLKDPDGRSTKQEQSALRRRLRMRDIDVGDLEADWVSHMSVRTFLRKDLNVDTGRDNEPTDPKVTLKRIRGLVRREESIITNTLSVTEGFNAGQWTVHTEIRLIDDETGEFVQLTEFLQHLIRERLSEIDGR